jgi:glycosyltransferase involved in cell wall biosynthesis
VHAEAIPFPEALAAAGDAGLGLARGNKLSSAIKYLLKGMRAAWAARKFSYTLARHIKSREPVLVHSNGIKCHLLLWMMGDLGVPVVWHVRDFLSARPLMRSALYFAARSARQVVTCSEAVAVDTRTVLPQLPVRGMLDGIDIEAYSPGPGDGARLDALAQLPPAPESTVRIGMLGIFARWKGQDHFLQAAARFISRQPGQAVRFYIVGGPLYQTPGSQFSLEELQALAARLGLVEHVGFVPFQRETPSVYRALDVVAHCSTKPEPLGRTVMEPMSCARAVIATLAGGVVELIAPEQDALAVPPNDVEALAQAFERLATNAPLRNKLAAAARKTAEARFSNTRMIGELLEVYRGLKIDI